MSSAKRKRDSDSLRDERRPKRIVRHVGLTSKPDTDGAHHPSTSSTATGASNASEDSWPTAQPQKRIAGDTTTSGKVPRNNFTSHSPGNGQQAMASYPPNVPIGSPMKSKPKRKRNDEDGGEQNDRPRRKRVSKANPETQCERKQLPARRTLNSDVDHVSSARPPTQVDTSTKTVDVGTAVGSKLFPPASLSNVGGQPGSSTLGHIHEKRKRWLEEEDNKACQPQKAPRLAGKRTRDMTSHGQHIYRLSTEVALNVFSWVGDEDVTKVRRTCRWFHTNMSDRFAEYCGHALDKKLTAKNKSWELSLTRSSMDELLLVSHIPRVERRIQNITIYADCPSLAGVRVFRKMDQRALQGALPADQKRTLRDISTLKHSGIDETIHSGREMEHGYECEHTAHATFAACGEDASKMVRIFELLIGLKHIHIGGWSKNMGVDCTDVISGDGRKSLLKAHDDRLHHVFNVVTAAVGSSKLTLDSLTVNPTLLKALSGLSTKDGILRALDDWEEPRRHFFIRRRFPGNGLGAMCSGFLQSAPNLKSLEISLDDQVWRCERISEALARYHSPRLRSIRLEEMDINGEALCTFLKGHKDSLRRLDLREIVLLGGGWRGVWKLLRDELQLESASFARLRETSTARGFDRHMVGFPWNQARQDRETALLGPQDDGVDRLEPVEEMEVTAGLDRMIEWALIQPKEESCWWLR
ncbi:uncharacterized protein BKCO1_5400083 [Diplodia corticola]|uniref:F-box domain-containing protein n=1 Tax=Diplodia corticola TaxID=236234 RepID=A0A1J9QPU0_9PEZI|nr:uncharacterized protein BKCO1_5400083 [Diplodia corticola]OJD30942.1 hypothetical protein BKCO1_5400083 [Diplodia corticola]